MINSIKTEFKTFCHLKSIWIAFAVLLVIVSVFYINSYNAQIQAVDDEVSLINEIEANSDGDVDYSELTDDLLDIYKTYNPKMALNNFLGLLIGLGLIIFPIISALFVGTDYGRSKTIKCKIAYYSLLKTYISKIIVICTFMIFSVLLFSLIGLGISSVCWGSLEQHFTINLDYSSIDYFTFSENLNIILLTIAIFIFYSLVSFALSAIFKSSVAGLVSVIVINYFTLPTEYAPHNVIFRLISEVYNNSSSAPYQFVTTTESTISASLAILLFAAYFAAVIAFILILAKKQKNN